MIGFFIKKSFFDMWDNLYAVIIMNLGFYFVIAATFGSGYLAVYAVPMILPAENIFASFLVMLILLIATHVFYNVYAGAVSGVTKDMAHYIRPSFAAFGKYFKETWKSSAVYGLIQGIIGTIFLFAASFYFSMMDNWINAIILFVIVEVYLFWLLASQYFLTLQANFDKKVFKNMKKMLLILLDNTAFTIFGLGLLSVLTFGISIILFLLFPGFSTILLMQSIALKLRMYKYDYLEENPDADRKKIPWDALLVEEEERVGKRTLKGMIFPWKQ